MNGPGLIGFIGVAVGAQCLRPVFVFAVLSHFLAPSAINLVKATVVENSGVGHGRRNQSPAGTSRVSATLPLQIAVIIAWFYANSAQVLPLHTLV